MTRTWYHLQPEVIEFLKELVEDDVCQVNPKQGTRNHWQFPRETWSSTRSFLVQSTGTCWVSLIAAAIAETRGPLNSVSRERGA